MKKVKVKKNDLIELYNELESINTMCVFDESDTSVIVDCKFSIVPNDSITKINVQKALAIIKVLLGDENPHIGCEYYNINSDSCSNHMTFKVSRHNKCIDELINLRVKYEE